MLKKPTLISIVVTTYNRPEALALVLRGLLDQTDKHFEIIIADDGSTDSTRDMIHSFQSRAANTAGPNIVHAWQPDEGFRASAARNLGVSVAGGDYLVFLDGDCIPRPDFIHRHRQLSETGFMVSGSRVLLSAAFTTELLAAGTNARPVHTRGLIYWFVQRLAGRSNKVVPLLPLPDSPLRHYRSVQWKRIKSCNLAIWRSDYDAVNGFDESFVGWGHEDADLVLRLARHGVRRKGGAFATEVLHLWHKENTRTTEAANRQRVEERMKTHLVRAPAGVSDYPKSGNRISS